MKKNVASLVMLFICFCLVSCGNGNKYSLTIKENAEYLYEELPNEVDAGTVVSVKTKVLTDSEIEIYVNNQPVEQKIVNSAEYWLYEFVMPEEEVEIKITLVEPSYYVLNGEYICGLVARKNVMIARSIDMRIENGIVYIYTKQLQGKLVKKNEVRDFSVKDMMYCTDYAEELIAKFNEIEGYFMLEGSENGDGRVYNYYFFEFEDSVYSIHTVDVNSEEGTIQEVLIYRMDKIA